MSRRLSLSLRLGALLLALGLAALAARVGFGAAATAGPGVQSGGVQFLDDAPITITWPVASASLTLTVELINTSANPRQAWLTLTGLADAAGQPPPAGLLPAMPVALEFDAHEALAVPLALQRAAGLAGQYTGRLVVYDDAGGLSRRPLTLVVAAAGPLPDLTAQPVLDTAFLPQLSLATVNAWPSPLAGLGLSAVTPARVAVAPEASPPRLVGLVADSQGRLGRVWHEGSELLVSDLTRAGAYAGQVDLSPAAAGGESALTVQVRDLALWAAIALGLGLVASTWLERTATYDLPRRRLEVRLRRLQEEAQASQNAARGTLPPAWPFGQQVFEAYTADPDSLLNKAAREVLARFDAAQTAEERSRWGPNGDEAKKLEAYPEALAKLNDLAVAAFAQLKSLADLDGQPDHQQWGLAFDQTPAHQAALDAIGPTVITSAAGLEQRTGQLRGAIQWLNDFRQVYIFVAGILAGISHPNTQAPFIHLLQYLYGSHVTGPDVLPILREQAHALALELSRASVPFGGAKAPAARLTTPAAAPRDWAELLSGAPLADISTASAADLQEALRRLERAFNWLAAVAVFATGMLTLYYPKPAFGSLADYLSLLLWGVTVKAGVELARTVLPPLFGRS